MLPCVRTKTITGRFRITLTICAAVLLFSLPLFPAWGFSPNHYYEGISDVLITSNVEENGLLQGYDKRAAGVISAKELSEIAEEIIEDALSHREEINVESVRGNDARVVADGSLVVIVFASVEETGSAAPDSAGPIMALSIDLFRAKPPGGLSPGLATAMPKALMVPSDAKVFRRQLREKLSSRLRLTVIGNIRLFDNRN